MAVIAILTIDLHQIRTSYVDFNSGQRLAPFWLANVQKLAVPDFISKLKIMVLWVLGIILFGTGVIDPGTERC